MKLAEMTWAEVSALSRETLFVIPTGSLEQHGPHLPLFTDSILCQAVSDAVEAALPTQLVLTPCLWLGASAHHLGFAGSLSASSESYISSLKAVIRSLSRHGFYRFFVMNGHGGNTSLNDVALRDLKAADPTLELAHEGYWDGASDAVAGVLTGPLKAIAHACEAETSLMLHVRPDLVRMNLAQDDGLEGDPGVAGRVSQFDEITERGNFGFSSLGTAEKGKQIFEACVATTVSEVSAFCATTVLRGIGG